LYSLESNAAFAFDKASEALQRGGNRNFNTIKELQNFVAKNCLVSNAMAYAPIKLVRSRLLLTKSSRR
jgi:hypothetical protein